MSPRFRTMIAVALLGIAAVSGLLLLAPEGMESRVRWIVAAPIALAIGLTGYCLTQARLPARGTSVAFAFASARATVVSLYGVGTVVLAGCAWLGLGFAWLWPLELACLASAIAIDGILDRASRRGERAEAEQAVARTERPD